MCAALPFQGNQAVASCSDQVLPVGLPQRFPDKGVVLRPAELKQCPLHGLFMGIPGNVYRLHGPGIQAGIEHAGAECAGGGIKVLYLFRLVVNVPQILGQFNGAAEIAAGMGGNQVGNQILLFPQLTVDLFIPGTERVIDVPAGFSHDGEDPGTDMLRGHFQLSADMMLTQFPKERIGWISHDIVVAESGTDEYLFDARQPANFPQQLNIIRMIYLEVRAGLWKQALPVFACPGFQLLLACGMPEIRGRTADIVNIALEIRHLRNSFRLAENGFMGTAGDNPALQERDGAERAGTETPAGVRNGKADLLNGGNAACRIIIRMPGPCKRKGIDAVQFGLGKRFIRNVLNEITASVRLGNDMPPERILFLILDTEGLGIGALAVHAFLS